MPTEFWRRLGAPRTVCAPMVDASELAFRSLTADYGCELGYTPMMHGMLMSRDSNYRARQIEENFSEELNMQNSEWVTGVLERPGMADMHLDVVDASLCALPMAELAAGLAPLSLSSSSASPTARDASASTDDDEKQEKDSPIDVPASADVMTRIYTVHRDAAFRYRVRRPRRVFAQFSGNVGGIVLEGARHVQGLCDAIDLNFGCPQDIARRGHYGAFLLEEWPIMKDLVSTLYCHLDIPVTVKIRKVGSEENTLALARMLQDHGAQVLTIHGRTRHQKQQFTGAVDRAIIRKIKNSLRIPVIANGGIQTNADVAQALEETGADAVMSAEGLLENPALFADESQQPDMMVLAQQYLDKCRLYPCPDKYMRKHFFDLLFRRVNVHTDIRDRMTEVGGVEAYQHILAELDAAQRAHGHTNAWYNAQPSWYARHTNSANSRHAKAEAARALDESSTCLEAAFEGGLCIFDE